jgi:hypothetical protein
MSSLNTIALLALLPLLASLQIISANPLDRRYDFSQHKRATGNVAGPLLFQQVSESMGISAQMVSSNASGRNAHLRQMFLGTKNKVYVLDKSENNPVQITGKYGTHPAWAVEYDLASNDCECL